MKAVLCALIFVTYARVSAQGIATEWFPTEVGNQWVYEHEVRDGQINAPEIRRWQTVETIIGTSTTPDGLVLLRRVEVKGDAPGGWLQTVYGRWHFLLRNECLYFLNDQIWNGQEQLLRPQFREQTLDQPQFCFPLAVGKQYGKDSPPGWVPSRVVGMGPRNGYTPESVSKDAFDVVVHLVSADKTHLWFEKGVGITGMWDWHDGSYSEYRVRLVRFQPADKPAFEVASIKPFDPDSSRQMWIGMDADPGMARYTNISLKECIRAAYRVRDFQIEGPAWISDARGFEITAKLPSGAQQNKIPEMLQALLVERFKLSLRRDMKEQSVYALVAGKDGPKLKRAEVKADNHAPTSLGPDGKPRPLMGFQYLPSGVLIQAPSASLGSLAELLSRFTEQPVVDMTGLDGQYEFDLKFAPESTRNLPPAGTAGPDGRELFSEPAPSVSNAVQQYGLKLERRKAPMEMLTITRLERMPTEN